MRIITAVFSLTAFTLSVSSIPVRRDVPVDLIPQFGHAAGLNPTGTGNCDGVNGPNGLPIAVPCSCPPDRDTFIADLNANVAAGHAVNNPSIPVSFPTDNSPQSQLARIDTALVTLQNLNGPGVGCPAASTTFVAQQQAALAAVNGKKRDAPGVSVMQRDVPENLIPEFGVTAGQNPTGTGDCSGVNGIKIPCSCPPDRQTFINDLNANVAAGHAVNNPSISVSFPTDNSPQSQLARIDAALVTLQNLNGPGVGCPAASTTFVAQQQAALAAVNGRKRSVSDVIATKRDVPENLVPEFGVTAGQNPTGTGDCTGINDIKIPCSCPPDRQTFINDLNANVAAGHAVNNPSISVSFPTDDSKASQLARIDAALVTLQNLNGPGVGCPAASTTFGAQQAAILALPNKRQVSSSGSALRRKRDVPTNLVPEFGVEAGQDPTGTGNCAGIDGPNGKPIEIPCSCPPDRDSFISSLNANVAAGHAINNPSVPITFPTDNSAASKVRRIQAAIVTLQNLHGPGVGCPAASTTFSAQLSAAQAAERR